MSDLFSAQSPARLVAVLGPTNTGKTHLAVERMLGHASGMIGLPLRLLAREIYDRVVKLRGVRAVALITGEEKIVPPRAHYFVCTVEAMPLARQVEFLAVDEIQLVADPERGHLFTHRLLHARGVYETMFLGAGAMAPLVRRLLPEAEIVTRERFSALSYSGSRKLTRLPRRSAVVAFSADQVYAIAELIRRQRGGAAVVMGSLSPRTRNAQVALYQSGEVDFLVATDAIGMGLNMDVDHVAFAGLTKFDGKRSRLLYPQEVGQIAGRAGRYRTDGTFGVTGGLRADGRRPGGGGGKPPLRRGGGGAVAQWDPRFPIAGGALAVPRGAGSAARPQGVRRGFGRARLAASGRRSRRRRALRGPIGAVSLMGRLPDTRFSQDHPRRAYRPGSHLL